MVGRLTGVTYADGTVVSFAYDAAGNRTSMTSGGSTTAYSYDAAGQLKTAGSTSYAYDPAGNRISAGTSSFTYDDFGNLASATAGATTIAYRTNGSGLRVSATGGGVTTTYSWDAAAALPALLSDGTNGYLSADSTLLAETNASANAYPLTDAQGSVRAQTDSAGSLTASATYGVSGDVRSSAGSIGSLGYTGALTDPSGLVYLNARSLDPTTGTFTSRDPVTPGGPDVTGFNPYAYAGQNPTTYTDPSGRDELGDYGAMNSADTAAAPTANATEDVIGEQIDTAATDLGDRPYAPDSPPDPEPTAPEPDAAGGSGGGGGGGGADVGGPGEPGGGSGGGGGGEGGGGGQDRLDAIARAGGDVGKARVDAVAEATNAQAVEQTFEVPGYGQVQVDVVAGDGTPIEVGGPSKGFSPSDFGNQMRRLRGYADSIGKPGQFWYDIGTPQNILDIAANWLDPVNVIPIPW